MLAITRSNDLFSERGKRGLSLEPFGRAGQLSAKWADRKKENFWPLKLMTQLHWEPLFGGEIISIKKIIFSFPSFFMSSAKYVSVLRHFGVKPVQVLSKCWKLSCCPNTHYWSRQSVYIVLHARVYAESVFISIINHISWYTINWHTNQGQQLKWWVFFIMIF